MNETSIHIAVGHSITFCFLEVQVSIQLIFHHSNYFLPYNVKQREVQQPIPKTERGKKQSQKLI